MLKMNKVNPESVAASQQSDIAAMFPVPGIEILLNAR